MSECSSDGHPAIRGHRAGYVLRGRWGGGGWWPECVLPAASDNSLIHTGAVVGSYSATETGFSAASAVYVYLVCCQLLSVCCTVNAPQTYNVFSHVTAHSSRQTSYHVYSDQSDKLSAVLWPMCVLVTTLHTPFHQRNSLVNSHTHIMYIQ